MLCFSTVRCNRQLQDGVTARQTCPARPLNQVRREYAGPDPEDPRSGHPLLLHVGDDGTTQSVCAGCRVV